MCYIILENLFGWAPTDSQAIHYFLRRNRLCSSIILYLALNHGGNLIKEYSKLNWAPFTMGLVVVGLETGFIYAYKAGWQVSTAFITQSSFLSAALIFVGYVLYHEPLTWNKLAGVGICLVGLFIINFK